MKTKTQIYKQIIDEETATSVFDFLLNNGQWEDGIYSKRLKRVTRKAYSPDLNNMDSTVDLMIMDLLIQCFNKLNLTEKYLISDIYVNYYRNGQDSAPSHSHPGQTQLVLSLGTTRTLIVGNKHYNVENGDVIIFGSSTHQVPQELHITTPRISIATFMVNKNSI